MENNITSIIGTQIKNRRRECKITLKELANKIGSTPKTLCEIETGKSNPTIGLISRIAKELDLELTLIPIQIF